MITAKRLGVGFVGGGLDARAHLRSWTGVHDADVQGVWSPNSADAADSATLARRLDIGPVKPYRSIAAMVADPAIHALWLCGPAAARLESMEEVADAVLRAKGKLIGVASERPLALNVADAERVTALAAHAGLKHAYLETPVFAPPITAGKALLWADAAQHARPHLARATDEAAPALLVRFLLTPPNAHPATLRPRRVTGEPAAITIEFETPDGTRVTGEARTGQRQSVELHGPGSSMSWESGAAGSTVTIKGKSTVAGAADGDAYVVQNQHFVRAFLGLEEPFLTFDDGLDAVRMVTLLIPHL